MAKSDPEAPRGLFPTDEEIAERAYELCFVSREHSDQPVNFMNVAEDELLDRAAKRALLPARSRRRSG